MQSLLERISFLRPGIWDLLQIAVVAYVFYRLLLLWAGTRALQMLLGLIFLFAVYALAMLLQLDLIRYLLDFVFTWGALALIILFAPELRNSLTKLGQSRFWRFLLKREQTPETVQGLAAAAENLARAKVGAIIAVEREVAVEEYARRCTRVDAPVTPELLATIFTPYSPLHDGAVIVRGATMVAAGCILPLTQFPVTDRSLGTRHRAAIGLSEETDALVIVVSEETGVISVAQGGRLEKDVSGDRLRELLGLKPAARQQLVEPNEPSQATQPAQAAAAELSLVDRSSSSP